MQERRYCLEDSDYRYDFSLVDFNKIKVLGLSLFKNNSQPLYLSTSIYSKNKRNFVYNRGCELNVDDVDMWFSWNYPDNSSSWSKQAKESFDKLIKNEKWTFIHKGEVLKSTNPTVFMMNYGKSKESKNYAGIALKKLKILEYKNGIWAERLKFDDGMFVDGKQHESSSIGYHEEYYDVKFSLSRIYEGTLTINFNLRYDPNNKSSVNLSCSYDDKNKLYICDDANNIY